MDMLHNMETHLHARYLGVGGGGASKSWARGVAPQLISKKKNENEK